MGTPTFEKKRSWLQSSDIPKRIWKVAQEVGSSGSYEETVEPFFPEDDRSRNTLDPNGGSDR
jgi:hypothetical protein